MPASITASPIVDGEFACNTETIPAGDASASRINAELFDRLSANGAPNSIVARRGNHDITEPEFRSRVHAWRTTFADLSQSGIALYEPDGVEFAAALIGGWYAGKSVYLPGDMQPDTCRSLVALDVALVGAFPGEFVTVGSRDDGDTTSEFPALNANDVRVVIFTSGSTGAPQAVPKRLSQLLAEVQTLESVFGAQIGASDVVATVSHQHIYGLLFKILWPLVFRRTFVAESAVYPEQLVALLRERKAAVVSGPAHLKRLPQSLDWNAARPNVAIVFSSGGPLPLEAAAAAHTLLGHAPIEVYGSSETGGIAWRQQSHGVTAPWTPLRGVTVVAHDDQLAIRSPHLPNDEWHLVQDNAAFDAFGNFTLLGRADRIAKIEGKRVSLAGIEDVLLQTGLVAEARVVQLTSARDELGAVVVPSEEGWNVLRAVNTRGLRARLDAALTQSLERLAHPRRWRWVDALPVNAVGKTSNAATVELFSDKGLALPAVHVVQSSADKATLELYVSSHLAVFDGHFRDIPILAGVVQIDWAMLFGRKYLGITATLDRMEAVKFQHVYQPGELLTVQLQWNAERRLLSFRYDSGSVAHSSGRIFFKA